jgi:dTDP-3-amino-3,4,6-trideoxy-alpha-D-glucose transaminase
VTVPFLDLRASYEELAPELDEAYRTVMASGRFLFGEQLAAFEEEFAAYAGAAGCAAVGSGFDALVLGLRALGVGPGDEVLVPTNTTAITWVAVRSTGAVPVGVEPLEETYTMDPAMLDAARNPRTRAVVPVHLYGRPADMAAILAWAGEHGLSVLADAAQAHGARVGGAPIGALGDAVAWSFYPSKNLGAFSDGGCVTGDDAEVIDRVRRLRNYGSESRERIVEVGVNSRLDELQAAFLRVGLAHLDAWNGQRAAHAALYLEALAGLPLSLPPADDATRGSWHQFVVRVAGRERLREALGARGVETLVHYPVPPFAQPALALLGIEPGTFPIAERLAAEVLSLPVGPHLGEDGARLVVEALGAALGP